MSGRNNNKLPSNLPQLQNLIKRDPPAYTEEVGSCSPGSPPGGFRGPSGGAEVGKERSEDSFRSACKRAAPQSPPSPKTPL